MNSTTCDKCGKEYVIGEWPLCPHGFGTYGDEPLTPYIDEHLLPNPVEIRTRGERRRIMEKRGLEYHKPRENYAARRLYFDLKRG